MDPTQAMYQAAQNLSAGITTLQQANAAGTAAAAAAATADAANTTAQAAIATANQNLLALQQTLDSAIAAYEASITKPTGNAGAAPATKS